MPFVPTPFGIMLCFNFTTVGQNWQFCVGVRAANTPPLNAELVTATAVGHALLNGAMQPLFTLTTTCNTITATDISSQGAPQYIRVENLPGSKTGTAAPMNAAVVVSLRTGLRGRSYRGRCYLGSISMSDVASAVDINSNFQAAIVAAFAGLQAALLSAALDMVVVSKQHNGVPRSAGATYAIEQIVVDSHIDSQRRRLFGRGT
jgi:hypothetical protein